MKMSYYYTMLLLIIVCVSTSPNGICRADPTEGFTTLPLNDDNIKLQKPYNEPLDDRYSFDDGVRKFWHYYTWDPKVSTEQEARAYIRGHMRNNLRHTVGDDKERADEWISTHGGTYANYRPPYVKPGVVQKAA
ncbi:uncharacterized protein LOC108217050 [Daucus carota subsp. sativus]|uniref:uncharacterized protein LOC108217050 n=1 Tax=Daucus carota subsp. sativus TaxID=79200 RepID=UPI0007EFF5CA|nr:PREDICTED: uncharacterized protein LOC108217050 [Daucus carota subsp. sativus]